MKTSKTSIWGILLSLFFVTTIIPTKAQITINNLTTLSDAQVAKALADSLKGKGIVSISNPIFKGVRLSTKGYQACYFTTATTTRTQMGFAKGIALTSGNTNLLPISLNRDPADSSNFNTGYVSGTQGELRKGGASPANINDLNILSGSVNFFNAALLEFDFIPQYDSICLRYVFGSEEYADKRNTINNQCTAYNDKCAFIISGQGISGGKGFDNDGKNIALLLNGSEVCVNSVNNGMLGSISGGSIDICKSANPQWISNTASAEYLGTIAGTELNGNTKTLVAAQGGLKPGETYHVKLFIADINDSGSDAIVYLEAGSLNSYSSKYVSITSTESSVCKGSSTTLNAKINGCTPNYSYTWSDGSGIIRKTSDTASSLDMFTVTPTATTTYTVSVADNNTSNPTTLTSSIVVTVDNLPTADAGLSSTAQICSGYSYTASATASNASSIAWTRSGTGYFNNSTLEDAIYYPSASDITAGSITLKMTVNGRNSCSSKTATDNIVLNITQSPNPPVTANTTQNFCTINNPTVANLVATGTNIKWYSAATGGSELASNTLLVNAKHYYATQTVGMCESVTRLDVTAIINANPATPTAGNNGLVCGGKSLSLTASSITGATYLWTGPNGFTSNLQNPTVSTSATLAMAGNYSVVASVNGCSSGAPGVTSVVVSDVSITSHPSNAIICLNKSTSFNCIVANGINNTLQWQYKQNGGSTWYNLTNNTTFSGVTTADLTVIGNSSYNNNQFRCAVSNSCTTLYTNAATLTVNTPSVTSKNVAICKGLNYSIGKHTYTLPGTYVDTLVRINGCDSIVTTTISYYADNHSILVDNGSSDTRTTSIACGEILQLKVNSTFSTTPNILWTPASSLSAPTSNTTYASPSSNTSYVVSFYNTYGCLIKDTIDVNVNTSCNGSIALIPSDTIMDIFDTIAVKVQVNAVSNLFALYPHLIFDNTYLTLVSSTAGSIMGTNIINTAPIITGNSIDFGVTKLNSAPAFSGSGTFYTFYFTTKNTAITDGYKFNFYLDDINGTDASGQNLDLSNEGVVKVRFSDKVDVWPGDLNNSKIVTVADILPIGYFYNLTGTVRQNASLAWKAQSATLWGFDKSNKYGSAYRVFADGNGDGKISLADQTSIGFNLNKSYKTNKSMDDFSKNLNANSAISTLVSNPQKIYLNEKIPQNIQFSIDLNSSSVVKNLYGMAFHLVFDPALLDLSAITYDYSSSIFGKQNTDFISIENNITSGHVDIGITRYSNSAVSNIGHILTLNLKVLPSNLDSIPLQLVVEDANDSLGNPLSIASSTSYIIFPSNNTSILDHPIRSAFEIYPNPSSQNVILFFEDYQKDVLIKVLDVCGKEVRSFNFTGKTCVFEKELMSSGTYFIRVQSKMGVETRKVLFFDE